MYKMVSFGGVTLPTRMTTDDLSTGSADNSLQRTVGGVFDLAQGERRLPLVRTVTHEGMYAASSAASLYTQVQALRNMLGTKAHLVRRRYDGAEQWTEARLQSIEQPITVEEHFAFAANIRAVFAVAGAAWRASTTTARTVAIGQGLTLATVNNSGTEPVSDAILTITATTSITSLSIELGNAHLSYTATIQAGDTLVIDCGALTVVNDGVGDYDHLVLSSNHALAGWLELAPGNNDIQITATGTGSLQIAFYEQFI